MFRACSKIILILLFQLSACGFQVIYKDEKGNLSQAHELAAIRIKKDRNRVSQEFKNNLYDILNPDDIKVEPKYFLILNIKKTVSATFITLTGASGRNKVTISADYELQNLENAAVISRGKTTVNDSYDVTANRYGTYVSEDSVQNNLTEVAAQNIRNSLVNDFIEARKKCDGQIKVEEGFICPFDAEKKLLDFTPHQQNLSSPL